MGHTVGGGKQAYFEDIESQLSEQHASFPKHKFKFKIRIVNMQYVGAVKAVCGSGSDTNFYAIPQFGEFRNIPCLKLLIEVFFQKGVLLAPMGGAFSFISF